MLTVLAGLPVLATTCEALCEPGTAVSADEEARASMHDGMAGCHESPATPSTQRLTGASNHDCNTHDGGLRETEAALRSSRVVSVPLLASDLPIFADSVTVEPTVLTRSAYTPPPDTVRSHTSRVLRI